MEAADVKSSHGAAVSSSGDRWLIEALRALSPRGQVARLRHLLSVISSTETADRRALLRRASRQLDFLGRQLRSPILHREAAEASRRCVVAAGGLKKERFFGRREADGRGPQNSNDSCDDRKRGEEGRDDECSTERGRLADGEEGGSSFCGRPVTADGGLGRHAAVIPFDENFFRWTTIQSEAAREQCFAATHRARLTNHHGLLRRALLEEALFLSSTQCNFPAALAVLEDGMAGIDHFSDAAEFLREYVSLSLLSGQLECALSTTRRISEDWERPFDAARRNTISGLLHLRRLEFNEAFEALRAVDRSALQSEPTDALTSRDVASYIALASLGSDKSDIRSMLEEEDAQLIALLSGNPTARAIVDDFLSCNYGRGMHHLRLLRAELESFDPFLSPAAASIFEAVVCRAVATYARFVYPLRLTSLEEDFAFRPEETEHWVRLAIDGRYLPGGKLDCASKALTVESQPSCMDLLRRRLLHVQQNRQLANLKLIAARQEIN